jgi:hypothetical protein
MRSEYNQIDSASKAGDLALLRSLRAQGHQWTNQSAILMAYYGHLACLQFAHEDGCPITDIACSSASSNGHLDCLKFLHTNNIAWRFETCIYAAINGHFDCLVYAHTNGCPILGYPDDTLQPDLLDGYNITVECLQYIIENGIPWKPSLYEHYVNKPKLIRYLLSLNTHRPGVYAATLAIDNQCIESFMYIYESFEESEQERFWKEPHNVTDKFILGINLDERIWRKAFPYDLSANLELEELINKKKKQIVEQKAVCDMLPLESDIIKYIVHQYI